jgi:hypothetical protein
LRANVTLRTLLALGSSQARNALRTLGADRTLDALNALGPSITLGALLSLIALRAGRAHGAGNTRLAIRQQPRKLRPAESSVTNLEQLAG